MAATHVVAYDNVSGYIHAIWDTATYGSFSNVGTYEADDYIDLSIAGHVLQDLGTTLRAIALTSPTFDNTDHAGFGALEVDVPGAPTDTQERSDGDRLDTAAGGRDGDTPDYTFA